jgi:hypothetical protein
MSHLLPCPVCGELQQLRAAPPAGSPCVAVTVTSHSDTLSSEDNKGKTGKRTRIHGAKSQKTVIFNFIRTSKVKKKYER